MSMYMVWMYMRCDFIGPSSAISCLERLICYWYMKLCSVIHLLQLLVASVHVRTIYSRRQQL